MSDTEKPAAAAPEKTAPSSTEADLTKYKVSTPRRSTLVAIKKPNRALDGGRHRPPSHEKAHRAVCRGREGDRSLSRGRQAPGGGHRRGVQQGY